jgi:hypothetical protein
MRADAARLRDADVRDNRDDDGSAPVAGEVCALPSRVADVGDPAAGAGPGPPAEALCRARARDNRSRGGPPRRYPTPALRPAPSGPGRRGPGGSSRKTISRAHARAMLEKRRSSSTSSTTASMSTSTSTSRTRARHTGPSTHPSLAAACAGPGRPRIAADEPIAQPSLAIRLEGESLPGEGLTRTRGRVAPGPYFWPRVKPEHLAWSGTGLRASVLEVAV